MSSSSSPRRRLDGPGPIQGSWVPASPSRPTVSSSSGPLSSEPGKPRRRWSLKNLKGHSRRWWIKRTALAVAALVVVTAGYLGFTTLLAAHRIIVHHKGAGALALNGKLSPDEFKGEEDGRVNILILGVGGGTHDGPELSDTMLVVSIDPQTKDVAMLSVPRDLYVKIPGYGYSKINSANSDGGPTLAEQVVQTVIGVPIQYYVHIDFSGFQQAVDAVGGIDITNTTLLDDPTYPCDSNQGEECGFYLPPGQYHMNGALALKYSRCRKGTCGNDFGRAARQQQVLVALRAKALTISTLTNPVKLGQLISAVGSHVKTDLQLSDMEKLLTIMKSVNTSKITEKVLTDGTGGLLVDVYSPTAGDILEPQAGAFNYTQIHNLVSGLFVNHYITDENAKVEVENGSGIVGAAAAVTTSLAAARYTVLPATNAAQAYAHTEIIDYTDGKKPYTVSALQQRFGVTAIKETRPSVSPSPSPATAQPDIVVILGANYSATEDD